MLGWGAVVQADWFFYPRCIMGYYFDTFGDTEPDST